jgi:hypothetical protein
MLILFAFVNINLKNSVMTVFDSRSMQKCFGLVAFDFTP